MDCCLRALNSNSVSWWNEAKKSKKKNWWNAQPLSVSDWRMNVAWCTWRQRCVFLSLIIVTEFSVATCDITLVIILKRLVVGKWERTLNSDTLSVQQHYCNRTCTCQNTVVANNRRPFKEDKTRYYTTLRLEYFYKVKVKITKGPATIPAAKRSASVAPEVNLRNRLHVGFETYGRYHQSPKTGVSLAP